MNTSINKSFLPSIENGETPINRVIDVVLYQTYDDLTPTLIAPQGAGDGNVVYPYRRLLVSGRVAISPDQVSVAGQSVDDTLQLTPIY